MREAEMLTKLMVQPEKLALSSLIERYIEEHSKMGRSKRHSLKQTADSSLGKLTLDKLTAERLVRFGRQRGVAGITLSNDLSALSTVLKHAEHVWRIKLANRIPSARYALRSAGFLDPAEERKRRPEGDELDRIKAHLTEHSKLPLADIVDFATHSAMRLGEIVSLRWADYRPAAGTIIVRQRKHPTKKRVNDQEVPLLKAAAAIIERQPRGGALIFPAKGNTVSMAWTRACRELGIEDLHFHDNRHDAASSLFEMGYQIPEVAMFTGHKDWKQLKRYTQISAEKLRRLG
jgi:integrase